jgi:hypothetical protein
MVPVTYLSEAHILENVQKALNNLASPVKLIANQPNNVHAGGVAVHIFHIVFRKGSILNHFQS